MVPELIGVVAAVFVWFFKLSTDCSRRRGPLRVTWTLGLIHDAVKLSSPLLSEDKRGCYLPYSVFGAYLFTAQRQYSIYIFFTQIKCLAVSITVQVCSTSTVIAIPYQRFVMYFWGKESAPFSIILFFLGVEPCRVTPL